MKRKPDFEVVEVGDEFIVVPTGEEVSSFGAIVTLNEASAYLFGKLASPLSAAELVDLLMDEYDVDRSTAEKDVDSFVSELLDIGLIEP